MQLEKLKKQNEEFRSVLVDIINGCVHPNVATRRVMLELEPIRKVLRKNPPEMLDEDDWMI